MQVEEYLSLDGLGLAELVEKGEVSPTELLDAAAAQIESTNDEINAVTDVVAHTGKLVGPLPLPVAQGKVTALLLRDLAAFT